MNTYPSARPISPRVLDHRIDGCGLTGSTLREELGSGVVLLSFLRHFGWIFCRETIRDLRRVREQDPSLPAPLFFTLAPAEPTRAFLAQLWPAARAIADPDQYFYREFQLGHGTMGKYLRPGVWMAGLRALFKGNGVGRPVGDPLTLPGLFLVRDLQIIAAHNFRHAGDHPRWSAVAEQVRAASKASLAE